MMLECEDTNVVSSDTIVNRIRKARHKVASNLGIDDAPSFGSIDYSPNGLIDCTEETERLGLKLVAHKTERPQ